MVAIWWVRRDLRLADNAALSGALEAGPVIPVFVLDPALLASGYAGEKRLAFLLAGLRQFDSDLRARGACLIVRHGDPVEQLSEVVSETGAAGIWAEADVSPYARRRDARAAARLPLHLVHGPTVFPATVVVKADGSPYTVYTPFSKAWKALPLPLRADLLPAPDRMAPPPDTIRRVPIPDDPALPGSIPFLPGEAEARRRLTAFVADRIVRYGEDRNRLDLDGTSVLSPYLRFGMVSARQAAVAALEAVAVGPNAAMRKGAETWLNELIWREFFAAVLYHFPRVRRESFREDLARIPWRNDRAEFAAWCAGRTGYPIVDAALRQLVQTGWMHNRARMIVASFLTKDLLVDWRWGERFFMQHLLDGDPAANNGGWQWTAGTGTDAAPYFRVFNPVLQARRFDPGGEYVRRWLPELACVPDRYVHAPWEMPLDEQRASGCLLGADYPFPIADHRLTRRRALEAYAQARGR